MRHTVIIPPIVEPSVSNVEYKWIPGSGYNQLPVLEQSQWDIPRPSVAPEHNFEDTYDYKARTFPHMQDMARVHGNHGYYDQDASPIEQSVPIMYAPDRVRLYRAEYLYHQFFVQSTESGVPVAKEFGGHSDLWGQLSRNQYTKGVRITRNPVDSEFSLWYLVVDLVELPKLVLSGLELVASLRKLRYNTHVLKLPFRDWMNGTLAYQFGFAAGLKDLREFIEILKRWAGQLVARRHISDKIYTIHNPVRVIDAGRSFTKSYSFTEMGANASLSMNYDVGATELHQTTKYYFVCPELHGLFSYIKAAVDRLGLLDPAAGWDLVPFSFVIDWFADVGKWLHKNLKPNWYPVDCVIADWAETLIRVSRYKGYITYDGPTYVDGSNNPFSLPGKQTFLSRKFVTGEYHQYARKRKFPGHIDIDRGELDLSFKKTILRANRAIIGSCLVGQRSKVKYRYYIAGRYIKRARV